MTNEQLMQTVQDVAVEVLNVERAAVTATASFKDDLDADSLDLVELVMALEERLDITVPEAELEQISTVGDAVEMLAAKVGAAA
ncbi:MAG: acyl carrier protein [Actinomycetota bacterium]|jgi:acyl carrier protein|nr:acyl carrier protein [Actinomycetota bacterium]